MTPTTPGTAQTSRREPAERLVLVGMSAAEVATREALAAQANSAGAEVAFLQLADPTLQQVLTRLADAGATRIVLVGVSGTRLGPGVSWLRRLAAAWWRERGGEALAPEVATAQRFGDPEASAQEWDRLVAGARPVVGTEPGLLSPAWDEVPSHRHQVLVCRGPRCTAAGAEETQVAMTLALMDHHLGDNDVLVTVTGCQFPCNHAPVLSVQPDDVWYGRVDADVAAEIVTEHLLSDRPVTTHRLARRRRAPHDG